MRQALLGPTKDKYELEIWRYRAIDCPRYWRECYLMHHGRWLHKHFFRFGRWVYAIAWTASKGKFRLHDY